MTQQAVTHARDGGPLSGRRRFDRQIAFGIEPE
jgi:hypothetical protein